MLNTMLLSRKGRDMVQKAIGLYLLRADAIISLNPD